MLSYIPITISVSLSLISTAPNEQLKRPKGLDKDQQPFRPGLGCPVAVATALVLLPFYLCSFVHAQAYMAGINRL